MLSLSTMIVFGMSNMKMDGIASDCPFSQMMNRTCIPNDNSVNMVMHHISLLSQITTMIRTGSGSFFIALFFVLIVFGLCKSRRYNVGICHSLSHFHRIRSQVSLYYAKQIFMRWFALKNKKTNSSPLMWAHVYS